MSISTGKIEPARAEVKGFRTMALDLTRAVERAMAEIDSSVESSNSKVEGSQTESTTEDTSEEVDDTAQAVDLDVKSKRKKREALEASCDVEITVEFDDEGRPTWPSECYRHELLVFRNLNRVAYTSNQGDKIRRTPWYRFGLVRTWFGMKDSNGIFRRLFFQIVEIFGAKNAKNGKWNRFQFTVPQAINPHNQLKQEFTERDSWARAGFVGGPRYKIMDFVVKAVQAHTPEKPFYTRDSNVWKRPTSSYNARMFLTFGDTEETEQLVQIDVEALQKQAMDEDDMGEDEILTEA